MSEILKQITVDVATSPKTHIALVGFFSSPFWLNWGEPLVDGAGKIISLNGRKRQIINRLIFLVAPLVSRGSRIIKPCYGRLLKVKGLGR